MQEHPIAQPGAALARLESALIRGDLSALSPAERLDYYLRTCRSLGLNPLTKPFEYLRLGSREVLYAKRDATDQLRSLRRISVEIVSREHNEPLGLYLVTARATAPDGRTDESIGAVAVKGLTGDALANAIMKAETKSKRRVTLSISGLGWLDETEVEVETIPDARRKRIDLATGELISGEEPARFALSGQDSPNVAPTSAAPTDYAKQAQKPTETAPEPSGGIMSSRAELGAEIRELIAHAQLCNSYSARQIEIPESRRGYTDATLVAIRDRLRAEIARAESEEPAESEVIA